MEVSGILDGKVGIFGTSVKNGSFTINDALESKIRRAFGSKHKILLANVKPWLVFWLGLS